MKFDKSGYAALGWSIVSLGLQVAENAAKAREFVCKSPRIRLQKLRGRHEIYDKIRRVRNKSQRPGTRRRV